MKRCIGLMLLCLSSLMVEAAIHPVLDYFQTQIPIDKNSFTCQVHYESYFSEISLVNHEFLSELGEGMKHYNATYLNKNPTSFFSTCDLHQEIIDDAQAHDGWIAAHVEVIRYESRTIVDCEGGGFGGCTQPVYELVPATKIIIIFPNGLELTSRGCGALAGCWD